MVTTPLCPGFWIFKRISFMWSFSDLILRTRRGLKMRLALLLLRAGAAGWGLGPGAGWGLLAITFSRLLAFIFNSTNQILIRGQLVTLSQVALPNRVPSAGDRLLIGRNIKAGRWFISWPNSTKRNYDMSCMQVNIIFGQYASSRRIWTKLGMHKYYIIKMYFFIYQSKIHTSFLRTMSFVKIGAFQKGRA